MFVTIDNQVYVKTGDLARYNARGELVYVGRAEFEIKLCGQRVETSITENAIMNWSPSKISNCLVTKIPKSSDLLVAYIVSNDSKLNTEEIRDYCDKLLPQYMVPSYFVVLDKFPLNFNGNIDRKQLPLPSLLKDASTNCV
jgi:acyl-CoA synthetase (AMP-forming)/AMP-acid ligase II